MQLKNILPLAAAQAVASQSLTDVLAQNNSTLSTLGSLLAANPNIVSALTSASNITILAPNNDAFSTFLNSSSGSSMDPSAVAALLTYHVLNGTYYASNFTDAEGAVFAPTLLTNASYSNVTGGQRVEVMVQDGGVHVFSGLGFNSTVVTPNVNFTGGTIHVIDRVLTLPPTPADALVSSNLTALAGALTAADLVDTVSSLQDVTIFAPTNAAFDAIGAAVANLTTEQLAGILTYHVVQGVVGYSTALANGSLTTVNGANVTVTVGDDGAVWVNSARVVVADVLVANGVVHVIDNVLNPANSTAKPDDTAATTSNAPAFTATGTGTAGVPFTSGVPTPTSTAPVASGTQTTSPSGSGNAGVPVRTAAVGAAALFGGAAVLVNL
ncbi:Fasciclin-like arabinogalactan protein-like protein 7 [Coniochaeta hoffmannii]|uniref:Fasciclin-like arabinogalactan protein-like protein 7 n=1 Tax=Coniochaeta hoffmannii TaxID=91930 RepID=A0AA38R8L1_9PEZI|nr:Fasciclin-like arabinogalactan protein-like protein 7 [Coniochaeta hoffmannii]